MEVFPKFYSPVIYFAKSASAKITEIVRALKILKIALKTLKNFTLGIRQTFLNSESFEGVIFPVKDIKRFYNFLVRNLHL
jgi:hypothetical protein